MRFEIKSGGVVAILFGVAALSGAVFIFGLLAGYDVGRESQSSAAQVATAYPIGVPPQPTFPRLRRPELAHLTHRHLQQQRLGIAL